MTDSNSTTKSSTRRRLEWQSSVLTWAVGLFVAIGGTINGWIVVMMIEIMHTNHRQDIELTELKNTCIMRAEYEQSKDKHQNLMQKVQLCEERIRELRGH